MKNVKEHKKNEIFIQIFVYMLYIHRIEFIIEFIIKIIKIDTLNMTVIYYVKLLILHKYRIFSKRRIYNLRNLFPFEIQ